MQAWHTNKNLEQRPQQNNISLNNKMPNVMDAYKVQSDTHPPLNLH